MKDSDIQTDGTLAGRLQGRRILVTGAAAGIGRATARRLAQEGASLALLDRDSDGLTDTARETNGRGYQVDITDESAVAEVVERAGEAMGGIDGIVNSAGIMFTGLAVDVSASAWRKVIDVNLTGSYIVIHSCLPWIQREKAATIVNIASGQGLLPSGPGHTAYAASKAGVINLTRALAVELAPCVRVNSVSPGMVDTAMAEGHRGTVGNYALKRLAHPEEIADVVVFLTSGESSYVTGAALAADGGRTFH